MRIVNDIPGYDQFVKIKPIDKGWSKDRKYYVETAGGDRMLLRISDIAEYENKKAEYGMAERAYGFGVPTSKPPDFGLCNGKTTVYFLSGWSE